MTSSSSIARVASILFLTAFDSYNLSPNNNVHTSIFTNAFIPGSSSKPSNSFCHQQHFSKPHSTALHISSIATPDYFSNVEGDLPERQKRHHVIEIQTAPRSKKKRARRKPKRVSTHLKGLTSNTTFTLSSPLSPTSSSTATATSTASPSSVMNHNYINNHHIPIQTPAAQEHIVAKNKGLLSREDEATLTYAIRSLRKAIKIRDDLALSNELSDHTKKQKHTSDIVTEEEWAKSCGLSVNDLRRVMLAGQDARTQLVAKNTGLVVQIAKRYHSRSLDNSILTLQDMVQEGNLGLMEAAERFDPRRGFKFGTYAAWWVRQRILRSIADHSRVIRLPAHVHNMLHTIDKTRKEMTRLIGRVPSTPELAHELGIPISKLQLYTDSSRAVLSLESPINQSKSGKNMVQDTRTLGDRIASDSPSPEDNAEVHFLRQDIRAVINELNSIERDVLIMRFGLDDGTFRSIGEVAELFNMSRERARLVEARAINKLRHPGRNYKLKEYVDDNGTTNDPIGLGIGKKQFLGNKHSQDDQPSSGSDFTPEQLWSI